MQASEFSRKHQKARTKLKIIKRPCVIPSQSLNIPKLKEHCKTTVLLESSTWTEEGIKERKYKGLGSRQCPII